MPTINGSDISKVVIACEAGMGSSVLLTSQMQKRLKPYDVEVVHSPVNQVPDDADLILCHTGLSARARQQAPDVVVKPFNMFMGDPVFDQVEAAIRDGDELES
jgi:galactose PTS system EIIB component